MSGGIRVDSRELQAALDKLASEVAAMPETHTAVVEAILPAVEQRTPRDSGDLAASWRAEAAADRGSVVSDVAYANIVESREHPVADAIAGSERVILETYEAEIAKHAAAIGFEVKR